MIGNRGLGLDPFEPRNVAVGRAHERDDPREVVEGLGEVFGALLQRALEPELLRQDLLLEQRREDDRPGTRGLEAAGHGRLPILRRGRGDDRRAELEAEVAGAEIHAHDPSPSLS